MIVGVELARGFQTCLLEVGPGGFFAGGIFAAQPSMYK